MIEVGSRWYWAGRHYTVPDEKPGKPRKAKPVDWIEKSRIERKLLPST